MSLIREINTENGRRSQLIFDAASTRSSGGVMPSGRGSGSGYLLGSDNGTIQQYKHYRGWPYVAINAVAQRLAGQTIVVARRKRGSSDAAKFIMSNPGNIGLREMLHSEKQIMSKWVKAYHPEYSIVESHPLVTALQNPNPEMVAWQLMVCTVASLELTGRSYWYFDYSKNKKLEIWPIPKHWLWLDPESPGNYLLRPHNSTETPIPIPKENIAVYSLPDPSNPTASASPIKAQIRAVETDEAIQQSQDTSFKRGITPGIILTTGRLPGANGNPGQRPVLTGPQRQQIFQAVMGAWEGVANFKEPLILDGLIESAHPFTTKPLEMDYQESGKSTKSRIMQTFRVAPSIIGESEGTNRAQATVAEQSFCDNVVNPISTMLSQVMTNSLGLFVDKSGSMVVYVEPCYARDREQTLREFASAARVGACTLNEFRANVNGLPPLPGGDVMLRPLNMVPVDPKTGESIVYDENSDNNQDQGTGNDNQNDDQNDDQNGKSKKQKSLPLIGRKSNRRDIEAVRRIAYGVFEKQWEKFQADYALALRRFFVEHYTQAADLFAAYEGTGYDAGIADRLYDPAKYESKLLDLSRPFLIQAMAEAAAAQLAIFKVNDERNIRYEDIDVSLPPELLTRLGVLLNEILTEPYWKSILAETGADIHAAIMRGLSEGLSHNAIERIIRDQLGGPHAAARANTIARTETGAAMNGGHMAAIEDLQQQGLATGKEWLNPCGNTSRRHHCKLTGRREKVDGLFDLGGEKTPYPLWSGLSARNRCNCQCTVLAVTLADGDLSQGLPGLPVG